MVASLQAAALLVIALQITPAPLVGRDPEWAGWLGLVALVAGFGSLAWWHLASLLPRPSAPAAPTARVLLRVGALAVPRLGAATALASVASGLPAGLVTSLTGARMGRWLAEVARPRTSWAAAAVGQSASRETAPAALLSAAGRLDAVAPPRASLSTVDASGAGGAQW